MLKESLGKLPEHQHLLCLHQLRKVGEQLVTLAEMIRVAKLRI